MYSAAFLLNAFLLSLNCIAMSASRGESGLGCRERKGKRRKGNEDVKILVDLDLDFTCEYFNNKEQKKQTNAHRQQLRK